MMNYFKKAFCSRLNQVDWNPVLLETNVQLALKNFTELILMVINKIAPFNQVRVKHNSAPWICREILVSIQNVTFCSKSLNAIRAIRGHMTPGQEKVCLWSNLF